MPLFRDLEGTYYEIPAAALARFRVKGDVAGSARLSGTETRAPPGDAARAYSWPDGNYHWPAEARQAGYLWEPRGEPVAPSAAETKASYFWDSPRPPGLGAAAPGRAGYFWDSPAKPRTPQAVGAGAGVEASGRAGYFWDSPATPKGPAAQKARRAPAKGAKGAPRGR